MPATVATSSTWNSVSITSGRSVPPRRRTPAMPARTPVSPRAARALSRWSIDHVTLAQHSTRKRPAIAASGRSIGGNPRPAASRHKSVPTARPMIMRGIRRASRKPERRPAGVDQHGRPPVDAALDRRGEPCRWHRRPVSLGWGGRGSLGVAVPGHNTPGQGNWGGSKAGASPQTPPEGAASGLIHFRCGAGEGARAGG